MRTDDKDDSSLLRPGDLPRSPAPNFPEEKVDDDPPHARHRVVDHVTPECSPRMKEHCDLMDDETSDGTKRGGDEEPETTNRVGDDDEETFEEGAEVGMSLGESGRDDGFGVGRRRRGVFEWGE